MRDLKCWSLFKKIKYNIKKSRVYSERYKKIFNFTKAFFVKKFCNYNK